MVSMPTRQRTIKKWLDYLAETNGEVAALEIGRVRSPNETVGHSTVVIARHPAVKRLVSIDINAATEYVARELLGEEIQKVEFINADSFSALEKLLLRGDTFDFLYLDGASDAEICFTDFMGALNVSREGSIIVLDDTDPKCDVKGNLTVPWAEEHGDIVEIVDRVPSGPDSNGQTVLRVLIPGVFECGPMHT